MGGPPGWELCVGLATSHNKKNEFVMKCYIKPWTLTDSLDKSPKIRKMDLRIECEMSL